MKLNKYIAVLLLIILTRPPVTAQKNAITLSPFQQSDAGQFMSLEYSHKLKNNFSWNAGLLVHFNIDTDNPDRHQERYLHHRFWAYNARENFGLSFGIQKDFYCFANKKINLFAYGQTMVRFMGAKSMRFIPTDTVVIYDSILQRNISYENSIATYTDIRNIFSTESILGLGISAKISNRLSFKLKAGFGFNIIANTPRQYLNTNIVVENALMESFGFSYSF